MLQEDNVVTNNRTVLKLFSGRVRWLWLVGNRDKGKNRATKKRLVVCYMCHYVSVGVSVTTFTSDQRKVFFVIKINWKLNCS